jgi:hypothetical protein
MLQLLECPSVLQQTKIRDIYTSRLIVVFSRNHFGKFEEKSKNVQFQKSMSKLNLQPLPDLKVEPTAIEPQIKSETNKSNFESIHERCLSLFLKTR